MNSIEQKLWEEAQAEAKAWINNIGGGFVGSTLSYLDPAAKASYQHQRAVNIYNWKVQQYNRTNGS